jgi:hypothetical protein
VFIHDESVAVAISAAKQHDCLVREAIVESGEPLAGAYIVEIIDDMNIAPEGGEELARGNVPVPIAPGPLLPPGQIFQDALIVRV